ncbi:hypothetical protein A167_00207 [Alcanivorax sp. S71-1-4]|uniref:YqcC family protein n=1 Tax=Alcanivorax sp. S71-1-4 TaxID=1177159 RepID=UPI00135B7FB9|nr:YqcC family protein [Alcanivorax sp. S71-1-4]KAF0811175.1 hypothetical protein A167_00207 [Alcanivorax sp. S71-1-4]
MPDTQHRFDLLSLMNELEQALRDLGAWECTPPPAEAFESSVPFSADTMDFTQWLQWVFVARFRAILEGGHALPQQCDVTPMAEEALRGMEGNIQDVLAILARIDARF